MESKNNTRKYHKSECIAFRSTKEEFGALSNMAGGFPIKIEEHWIKNSEVLYQALKYPNYPEIQKHIFHVKSPIFAKRVSRKYREYERNDWLRVRFKIMKYCLELKLQNNFQRFSKVLLSTNDKPIVEYSKKDKVWGAVDSGEYYEGVNALGRLLMELREKIKDSDTEFVATPPDVEGLRILNIDLKKTMPNNGYKT